MIEKKLFTIGVVSSLIAGLMVWFLQSRRKSVTRHPPHPRSGYTRRREEE